MPVTSPRIASCCSCSSLAGPPAAATAPRCARRARRPWRRPRRRCRSKRSPLPRSRVEILSEYIGSLKSRRTTTVQPQVEGFITRIAVRSGEQVQRARCCSRSTPRRSRRASRRSRALAPFARRAALRGSGAGAQQDALRRGCGEPARSGAGGNGRSARPRRRCKALDEQLRQQKTELATTASRRRPAAPSATSRSHRASASPRPPCSPPWTRTTCSSSTSTCPCSRRPT